MHRFYIVSMWLLLFSAAQPCLAQLKDTTGPFTIQPLFPQFLRPGDAVELQAQVIAKDTAERTGQVSLQLMDAASNNAVDGWFNNIFPTQYFTAGPQSEAALRFPVTVPVQPNAQVNWQLMLASDSLQQQASGTINILSQPRAQALPKGFVLHKKFFRISGKASTQPITSYTTLKLQDTVQVVLTITTAKPLQEVTVVDGAPAVLHTLTHPASAGKKLSYDSVPGGMRLRMPLLAAGTHRIMYCTQARYIGSFSAGYLQLESTSLKAPLVGTTDLILQVTE